MKRSSSSTHRRLAALTAFGAAAAAVAMTAGPAGAQEGGRIVGEGAEGAVPGSYVVVLDDRALGKRSPAAAVDSLARAHGASVSHRYGNAVRGFSGRMTRAQALALSRNPAVALVQQDRTVTTTATQSPTPSWGLDRVDQRTLPLNSSYTYPSTASNVTAYVIDTGIRTTHADFGGRAVWGTNTTGDGRSTDCNGHGTHVAGTVGGSSYGVAKGVRLVAVKVLGCNGSGSTSGVVAGIDWVTGNHVAGAPAVANMSLGGGADAAIDAALRASIADGVTYAVASGNENVDACSSSPARVAEAITVNATTRTDARASFSNYGSCTDLFAPGDAITSAWYTGDTATNTISGTSMATPHVAGAAALVLAATPSATPSQVWSSLSASATTGVVTGAGSGSPNRLLHVGGTTSTPPPSSSCAAVTNGTDVAIRDLATVTSPITVSGCSGNGSAASTVEVHIEHTYRGDLVVDLVAPNGGVARLSDRAGGSADDLHGTWTVDLSSVAANGTWSLRVRDAVSGDVGYVDSWTLDL